MKGKQFSGILEGNAVAQAKHRRMVKLMQLLMHGRWNVKRLASMLECKERTVNRLLNTLVQAGVPIDIGQRWEYFIASDNCPICGKTTNNHYE